MQTYRMDWSERPEPQSPTVELADLRQQIGPALRQALLAQNNDVHLFLAVVGSGKTQRTVAELNQLPEELRLAVFLPTQEIAKTEWQDKLSKDGVVRLMSIKQMVLENLLTCPHEKEISKLQLRRLPWFRPICMATCANAGNCPYHENQRKTKDAQILLLQHAHLPLADRMGLLRDRTVIIDEAAINHFRSLVQFDEDQFDSFRSLLCEFDDATGNWSSVVAGLERTMQRVQAIEPGSSSNIIDDDGLVDASVRFNKEFKKWLEESGCGGWNLLDAILGVLSSTQPIRCSIGADGKKRWWTTRQNLSCNGRPIIILDATGSRALYEAALPNRQIHVWPNEGVLRPASEVTIFADGAYPQGSLWSVEEQKATKTFEGICSHVDAVLKHHQASPCDVGFVTLKKLLPALRNRFPEVPACHLLHYGDLRGRNDIKDCRFVFVIGCQPPELTEVARIAIQAFGLDCDPETLVGDLEAQRKFSRLDATTNEGPSHEVRHFEFDNKYMKLAWELCVTAEVIQAVGRARVYEPRTWLQRVFVFSNIPTGMPATRVLTRRQHLRELGELPRSRAEHIVDTMQELAKERSEFGYAELAERFGVKSSSLRAVRYQQALKRATEELGLVFERGGDGQHGIFRRRAV